MIATFQNAKKSLIAAFQGFQKMVVPTPENLECAYEIQGEFDGAGTFRFFIHRLLDFILNLFAGCKRNLLLDSVRNKSAFESQIGCESDIRVNFFKATEKRVDVGISRNARRSALDVDHLQSIMPELTEQDVFDVFRMFQMFQREPKEMLTSRAEM